MKTAASTIAAVFFLLFILSTFVPYPAARAEARDAGFTTEEIDTGLQYLFERRFFSWSATASHLALLMAFALTGVARKLADRWLVWTGQRRILAALGVGLTFVIAYQVVSLPLGIARYYHMRAWEMSNLDLGGWLQHYAISFGLARVEEAICVIGLYALLILFPRIWWLLAAFGVGGLTVAYAMLAPILINPIYNEFTPLSESEWRRVQPMVEALLDKAGVPVQEILVMDASAQSPHGNAYFTGFGPTRRIVLYDNLFKKNYTDAEIESILAHEIGHWRHDHIVKGIALATFASLFGLLALDLGLRFAVGRAPWQLQSKADPAGLLLIMLLIYLGGWAVLPVQNGVTRYFEAQADHTSLELAGQPKAFIEAERKLARDNKSNVAPTPWNVWLYASHPPTVERIRMAEEWRKKN